MAQNAGRSRVLSAVVSDPRRREIIGNLVKEIRDHDLNGLAAELSYRLFVMLVPFVAFLASLGAILASTFGGENPARTVIDATGDSIPGDAADVVENELSGIFSRSGVSTLLIGLVGSLWTGGLAMGTVVKALDRIHTTEERRSRLRGWAVAIALTAVTGTFFVLAMVGLVLTSVFQGAIGGWVGIDSPPAALVAALGWILAFALVVAAASVLYWAAPSRRGQFRFLSLGGLGFGIIWVVGSAIFLFYIVNFGSYASTYGVLGGVILALGWLYFSSMAFFAGAELELLLHREDERS